MFSQDKIVALLRERLGAMPTRSGDDAVFQLDGGMKLAIRRVAGADWGVAWTALAPLPPGDDGEAEHRMRELLRFTLGRLYRAPDVVLTRDENSGQPVLHVRLGSSDDDAGSLEKINRLLNEAEMHGKRAGPDGVRPMKAAAAASLFSGMAGMTIRP